MITKKQFIEWLESKKPGELVGDLRCGDACPIAIFYRSLGREALVGHETVSFNWWRTETELPKWAQNFIKSADGRKTKQITAKTCLKIMEAL